MNDRPLRVAYFPDTFEEIDGVANTSRQFEAFARRRNLPFLVMHGGDGNMAVAEGATKRTRLGRSRCGFALDKQQRFDLLFTRHLTAAEAEVEAFDADVVHITGPSDVGLLGMLIAQRLQIPLAASWHTNLHQYAEQRSAGFLSLLPKPARLPAADAIRSSSLLALLRFYNVAQVLFAPQEELCSMLEHGTGKHCFLMQRGVDIKLFTPERRTRRDDTFVVGFVGRLSPEKSVSDLADIEQKLLHAGLKNFRFVIVGQGDEEGWLRSHLQHAEFTGVLRGEALAESFANMDALAFPSRTDTFGNVVLEALASGVPAVVTDSGGPQFLVDAGNTGFIARNIAEFSQHLLSLANDRELRQRMSAAARARATEASWDAVFEKVYTGYEHGIRVALDAGKRVRAHVRSRVAVGHLG